MNVEQNDVGYDQPKKSGKKGLFACGGIGCILVLLFCGGLVGLAAVIGVPFSKTFFEAQTLVSENQQVKDALGEPLEFSSQPTAGSGDNSGEFKIPYDWDVSGPNGEGTMKLVIAWKSFTVWEIEKLEVEVDGGETIDVHGSSELSLDVDESGIGEASAEDE